MLCWNVGWRMSDVDEINLREIKTISRWKCIIRDSKSIVDLLFLSTSSHRVGQTWKSLTVWSTQVRSTSVIASRASHTTINLSNWNWLLCFIVMIVSAENYSLSIWTMTKLVCSMIIEALHMFILIFNRIISCFLFLDSVTSAKRQLTTA